MADKPTYKNLCTTCNEDFASVTAFDMHRVGVNEYLYSPEHPDGRRCLTADEMEAKKMRLDKSGRWRSPASDRPAFWATAASSAGGDN